MRLSILTLLFSYELAFNCKGANIYAYTIPDVKVDLLSNGFRASIPDEPGISNVFFIMEIAGKCSSMVDYVQRAKNGSWSTEQTNIRLLNQDQLDISLLVQHNDQVFKGIKTLKIQNNRVIPLKSNGASTSTSLNEQCSASDVNNLFEPENKKKETTVVGSGNNAGSSGSCTKSQTVTNDGVPTCSGDLLFTEGFVSGKNLLDRWTREVRLGLNRLYTEEFVTFTDSSNNMFVENNVLNIKPTLASNDIRKGSLDLGDKCTSNYQRDCIVTTTHNVWKPPVNTAAIHTNNSFSFTYGRIEVRAKLPMGDWIFPLIVLQPKYAPIYGYVPQLRVAFALGNEHLVNTSDNDDDIGGSHLYGGAIVWNGDQRIAILKDIKKAQHFGEDFHNYTLIWQENSIVMAVDGEVYGEIKDKMDQFKNECFIKLGVSVGGRLEFPEDSHTGIKQRVAKPWYNTSPKAALDFWKKRNQWYNTWNGQEAMQVEYVRVYAV